MTEESELLETRRTAAFPLVLAALAFCSFPLRAEVPEVVAELRIDSPRVSEALGDGKTALEDYVSGLLVAEAEEHFPFVRWTTPGEASGPAPRLVLRMTERPVPNFSAAVELQLEAELGEASLVLSEPLKLYDGWDDDPPFTHDDDLRAFKGDLASVILVLAEPKLAEPPAAASPNLACDECEGWFFGEPLRRKMEDDFLGYVSLGHRLDYQPAKNRRVLLPIRMEELKARTSSRILVEFWVRDDQPGAPDGVRSELWMSPWAKVGDEILCKLTKLTVPPDINEPEGEFFWHDSLPKVLAESNLLRLDVFMKDYRLDRHAGLTTVGGAVTTGP